MHINLQDCAGVKPGSLLMRNCKNLNLVRRHHRICLEAMVLLSILLLIAYSMAGQFDPPPRNFACAATVAGIPDGHALDYQEWFARNGYAAI